MSHDRLSLRITTPLSVVAEEQDVLALRAEDASGAFGIMPGHADFLTTLSICVVGWRNRMGGHHFCAVRQGIMTVSGGRVIAIATRDAVPGDDLHRLEADVLRDFIRRTDADRVARVESLKLQLQAARHLVHFLQPGRNGTEVQ